MIFDFPHLLQFIDGRALSFLKLMAQNGIEGRFVGGCVRCALMCHEGGLTQANAVSDIDIAAACAPQMLMAFCEQHCIPYIPTGLAHGTVTVIYQHLHLEVTSLRLDTQTFGRKAHVSFKSDFFQDSKRRDFTMNALYLSEDGKLYDFHDGMTDLKTQTIRFIGYPLRRIHEDYLRLWRYFRFHGVLQKHDVDIAILPDIKVLKEGLLALSIERVAQEFFKILCASNAALVLHKTQTYGILETIFKKPLSLEPLRKTQDHKPFIDYITLFSIVSDENPFKLSRCDTKKLCYLQKAKHEEDGYLFLLDIAYKTPHLWEEANSVLWAWNKTHTTFPLPPFTLTGKDLLAHHLKPGIYFKTLLKKTHEKWFEQWFHHNKLMSHQECLDYAMMFV